MREIQNWRQRNSHASVPLRSTKADHISYLDIKYKTKGEKKILLEIGSSILKVTSLEPLTTNAKINFFYILQLSFENDVRESETESVYINPDEA